MWVSPKSFLNSHLLAIYLAVVYLGQFTRETTRPRPKGLDPEDKYRDFTLFLTPIHIFSKFPKPDFP